MPTPINPTDTNMMMMFYMRLSQMDPQLKRPLLFLMTTVKQQLLNHLMSFRRRSWIILK
jgi:hypothetical protein